MSMSISQARSITLRAPQIAGRLDGIREHASRSASQIRTSTSS
jgi:hypothetical protein